MTGRKVSLYLSDEVYEQVRASGLTPRELVRAALENPVTEEDVIAEIHALREDLRAVLRNLK